MRAAKIIENQQTHIVYYEDAWLEVAGVPVAYIPYFSAPDPTVTRQSGILAPTMFHSSYLGYRHRHTLFSQSRAQLRSDPDPDLSFRAGAVSATPNGASASTTAQYNIRVTGLFQREPEPVPDVPL